MDQNTINGTEIITENVNPETLTQESTTIDTTQTEVAAEPVTQPENPIPAPAPAPTVNVSAMTAAQVELLMAERLVVAKYPNLKIVPGSMVQELAHPLYSNKRRVQVHCPHCNTKVERATSDLHTFKACAVCIKGVRKANKLGNKLNQLKQLEALKLQLAAANAPQDNDAGDAETQDNGDNA